VTLQDAGCPRMQAMDEVSSFEEMRILTMEIRNDSSEDERDAS